MSASDVRTVPILLKLFETGWPVDSPLKIYTGLAEPGYAKGLPKNQAQQYDLLRQGYLLIKGVSQLYDLSMRQAADVVEVWRGNTAACITTDGSVVAVTARAAAAGTIVPSMLGTAEKQWTMNKLCQTARNVPCVTAQKDSTKSAAGRGGGSAPKKQRTK